MAIEDIERLKEKVEKDPNSKLFVPLAEEYKKAGMYDEAIDTLTKGLERQPSYLSARVSLGKIYIERGMLNEAIVEFEKVIAAIPDNLYAHKKLAEIYSDLGEKDKAIKEFKTVLKLNPMDEWAATSLSSIQEEPKFQPQEIIEEKVEELTTLEEEPLTIEEEKPFEIPITKTDKELFATLPEAGEEKPSEISVSEEEMGLGKTPSEAVKDIEEVVAETAIEAEELPEAELLSLEDILKESEVIQEQEIVVKEETVFKKPVVGDADQYILQGKYVEAMNVYKNLLSVEPDNKHILQRIEELKTLLKLLGKDKEALILRLDGFLEGIKKRRDELFGSP